jgi:hypothetical protein
MGKDAQPGALRWGTPQHVKKFVHALVHPCQRLTLHSQFKVKPYSPSHPLRPRKSPDKSQIILTQAGREKVVSWSTLPHDVLVIILVLIGVNKTIK